VQADDLICGHFLARDSFDHLPDDFTYVLNFAVVRTDDFDYDLAANGEGTARLMAHCRKAKRGSARPNGAASGPAAARARSGMRGTGRRRFAFASPMRSVPMPRASFRS
jgi:hypothetical protein